jgi:hypothetical protein
VKTPGGISRAANKKGSISLVAFHETRGHCIGYRK